MVGASFEMLSRWDSPLAIAWNSAAAAVQLLVVVWIVGTPKHRVWLGLWGKGLAISIALGVTVYFSGFTVPIGALALGSPFHRAWRAGRPDRTRTTVP